MTIPTVLTCLGVLVAVQALPQHGGAPGLVWQAYPELNQQITLLNGVEGATFDCAHLEVPLDYTFSSSTLLQLSLFKVNATEEPRLGSVLINFGGPGGTGAQNLPIFAAQMAVNIGPQWDLVSWDPRGTGKTVPFNCEVSPSELGAAHGNARRKRNNPKLASGNLTDYFLDIGWDLAGAQADAYYNTMEEIGRYFKTAFTARDMINIVNSLNEDGLLRYYGWSYGTALGAYTAAMFPDRIDRMVLDSNLDPEDCRAGHYGDFVRDTDKAFAGVLQGCFENRPRCVLAQFTNATCVDDLFKAVDTFLEPLNTTDYYGRSFTDASLFLSLIYSGLYYPSTWPSVADQIVFFLNGTSPTNTSASPPVNSTVQPYDLGANWSVSGNVIRGEARHV
jgi:pimeloyl-ACP methyl ester carboxylesterase